MNALSRPLPRNVAAHDRERADDPEDRVQRHGDRGDDQRQLERVDRLGRRERVPGGLPAVLERAVEDDHERPDAGSPRGRRARRTGAPSLRMLVLRGEVADRRRSAAGRRTTRTSRTTATAAAPAGLPLSIWPRMKTDETSVLYGRFPEMITSDPISPTAFANASATPDRIPGRMFGKITPAERRELRRAERRRRLLHLLVELGEHGLHRADDERERDEHQRQDDRRAREARCRSRPATPARRARAASGPRRSSAGRTAGR